MSAIVQFQVLATNRRLKFIELRGYNRAIFAIAKNMEGINEKFI